MRVVARHYVDLDARSGVDPRTDRPSWAPTTHYPEEGPAREVAVDGFWMQTHQVTNAQFAEFVSATGYVTVAERPLNPADYPGAPPENLQPGSMVFHRTPGPVDLRHLNQWWTWTPGACWNHPRGARSSLRQPRPTTLSSTSHSKTLRPTRTGRAASCPPRREWEVAARGGLAWRGVHLGRRTRATRPTARQLLARRIPLPARHRLRASTHPSAASRPTATACSTWPAMSGSGPPTGTADTRDVEPCCAADSYDPNQPQFQIPRKVIKGGSFLCADSYCLRYRPAARRPQMVDTGMSHIGFRCISRTGL